MQKLAPLAYSALAKIRSEVTCEFRGETMLSYMLAFGRVSDRPNLIGP